MALKSHVLIAVRDAGTWVSQTKVHVNKVKSRCGCALSHSLTSQETARDELALGFVDRLCRDNVRNPRTNQTNLVPFEPDRSPNLSSPSAETPRGRSWPGRDPRRRVASAHMNDRPHPCPHLSNDYRTAPTAHTGQDTCVVSEVVSLSRLRLYIP
jgi:hypothetical protein